MIKIVFIGAGSGFGAKSFVDILSFPELRECEVVLVDVNPTHLEPVAAFCRKAAEAQQAKVKITLADNWRNDGVLDGAHYVITSFAQGGPAYVGVPYHHEIAIPAEYGIYQNVADTAGMGGVFRLLRTLPELTAIGREMEKRSPGSYMLNYVNPMSMLTRSLVMLCPGIHVIGLCHNIQYGIRDVARFLGVPHKELCYRAAGVNHMDWFLTIDYLDGRNAYPDLVKAMDKSPVMRERFPVQCELLTHFGYWTTESSKHCAEYLPYFMPRETSRASVKIDVRKTTPDVPATAARWGKESDLVMQTDGRKPMDLARSHEYGIHIIHALETDNVYRMNINVINNGAITNLPDDYCVEVPCVADRTGIHPTMVGELPVHLAALCRGMADMQTLASEAAVRRDLTLAYRACLVDPLTAASAPPKAIYECFTKLLDAERPWLEPYWNDALTAFRH
ncbi:MAG: alpha-glucosidase/alpha-galactosidase [Spirochaetes bacterium]|nr:alpha-glucosidase/alpha-galactosidase [Spirochaetota bacterium]